MSPGALVHCIYHPFLVLMIRMMSTLQGDTDLDSNARVLALQLAVQQITLNVVPHPSNMHAGEEQGCFAITLQQTRLQAAIEDGVTDIRQVV